MKHSYEHRLAASFMMCRFLNVFRFRGYCSFILNFGGFLKVLTCFWVLVYKEDPAQNYDTGIIFPVTSFSAN